MGFIRGLFRYVLPEKPGNLVTYKELVALGACSEQRALFRQRFGEQVLITEAVAQACGHQFDYRFGCYRMLTLSGVRLFEEWERAASFPESFASEVGYRNYKQACWVKLAELLPMHRKR